MATSAMVMCAMVTASFAATADRTTLLIPLSAEGVSSSETPAIGETGIGESEFASARYADQAMGQHADEGWRAYVRLWKNHSTNPANRAIRRFLGLPLQESFTWSARRGRSSPRFLRWAAGSYAQIDTPHFVVYSRAGEEPSRRVVEDLERCYWIWTQLFFPLWEGAPQVRAALANLDPGQPIEDFLQQSSSRITIQRKMRVVLFRDAEEYQQALSPDYPGVERSTGFYANDKQTIFLYSADVDDAATRRHELVHQLFREATRSGLGRSFPAEAEGFWLIEGIAGYFESVQLAERSASVGGWDCSRLQFARYRRLSLGDVMPMSDLIRDGRQAAQERSDIARWYAHAIAQTHRLMDSGNDDQRAWIYAQLARRYRIGLAPRFDLDDEAVLKDSEVALTEFLRVDDDRIRSNPIRRPLQQLVLAECPLHPETISQLPPSGLLRWLDLTRIPLENADVSRLVPDPSSVEQLRLEATKVDSGLTPWLRQTKRLTELDLSWTKIDDSVIAAVENQMGIATLYLTGTQVTDACIDGILKMRDLETVDLQRTAVTAAGLERIRTARPQLQLNPLQLVDSRE
ncbi:MAG: DUF1570 domain-containing protein [Rubripirellula sp.]|nr:DUF1570 domain-containing protein [Rubripirellula sp.]